MNMKIFIEKLDGTRLVHKRIDHVLNKDEFTIVLYRDKLPVAIETKGDMKSFEIDDSEAPRFKPQSQV